MGRYIKTRKYQCCSGFADLAQWIEGLQPTTSPDVDWLEGLPGTIDHTGVSKWFQSGNRLVGVDKRNAIVVYRSNTIP